ncbi:MAG: glycine zipper 2TM domain-containing protein [Acidiferrobacterales bacterium]|nr:glycine zipper 2TM domain-containing protein [Acidiferrobacterales bacterium]
MKTTTSKSLKSLTTALAVAGALTTLALPASAKNYNRSGHSSVAYAQVVGVTPVVESYRVNNPVEHCWDEKVRTRSTASRSRTPEILGGLIGAAIGHEFGSGRGQDVATVAGAVLGASVGRDVKHQNTRNSSSYQVVQRCEVRDSYSSRERVVGYDVAYRYNGKVFHTQMAQHPGKRIRLNVTASPS